MVQTECFETSAYKIQTPGELPRKKRTTAPVVRLKNTETTHFAGCHVTRALAKEVTYTRIWGLFWVCYMWLFLTQPNSPRSNLISFFLVHQRFPGTFHYRVSNHVLDLSCYNPITLSFGWCLSCVFPVLLTSRTYVRRQASLSLLQQATVRWRGIL